MREEKSTTRIAPRGNHNRLASEPSLHSEEARKMSMKTKILSMLVFALSMLTWPVCSLEAQVLYATVVGSVTDGTGAVVPGATVTATETSTSTTLAAKTGSDGNYTISNAPAGTYTVKITKDGFKTFVANSVVLPINATTRLNGNLAVGSVSESVAVTISSAELQTDSGEIHDDLSGQQFVDLPVATRSYQSLLGTLPGAGQLGSGAGGAGGGGGGVNNPSKSVTLEFNGTSNANTDYRVEGISAMDAFVPWDSAAKPSQEAIATVDVVAGSSNVEQGLAAGAAVNVILKSGTNQWHGETYWYHTDQVLTAQPYFSAPGARKNKAIENDLGGTLGGPILKNRLFFFVSYEGDFTRQATPVTGTVPLPSVLAGNFQPLLSMLGNPDPTNPAKCATYICIFDPTTGTPGGTGRAPFSATNGMNSQCTSGTCINMIPTSRFNSTSAILDGLLQKVDPSGPNEPGYQNNYRGNSPNNYNLDLIDAKIDWNVTNKLRVSGRVEIDHYSNIQLPIFGGVLGSGQNPNFPLYDQFGTIPAYTGSFTYTASPTLVIDGGYGLTRDKGNLLAGSGAPNLAIPNMGTGIPTIQIGCTPYYDNWFCGGQYTGYGTSFGPVHGNSPVFSGFGNVTKVAGKNTWKFGFNIIKVDVNSVGVSPNVIAYDGGVTSDADPGQPAGVLQGQTNAANSYADFLIGAPTSWYTNEVNHINGNKYTESRQWDDSFYLGDTYQPIKNLTVAFGTGWEYYPVPTHGSYGMEIFVPGPNGTGTYEVCGFGAIPKDCGIQVSKALFTPRGGFAFRPMNNLVIRGGYALANDQFQMARNTFGDLPESLGYVGSGLNGNPYFPIGSLSVGPPVPANYNFTSGIISPTPNNIGGGGVNLPINWVRGKVESFNLTVQRTFGNWSTQAGYVGTHSYHMYQHWDMNYCPVGQTGNCEQFSPTFGANDIEQAGPLGSSHYNGLQMSLVHSFSKGYSLSANYTYSQWLGVCCNTNFGGSEISDPAHFNVARGLEPGDIRNVFNLTGIAQSPFGKGRPFLASGPAGYILGGWQLNGALYLHGGPPFSLGDGNINPGNAQLASLAPGVQRVSYPKTRDQWYNPKDVQASPCTTCGAFGNIGLDSLRAPGFKDLDLSLFRNFLFMDRFTAQFRAESFNLTNTPHWAAPSGSVFGNTSTANAPGAQITSVTTVGRLIDQRYFRLGLKIMF